ncbi:hypothetical protein [Klebsiella oxytoca]|uniref:hypothetical protein n=1 Tax=Klebsiella oxytoca TaxID=571 RepID=UPI0034D1F56A
MLAVPLHTALLLPVLAISVPADGAENVTTFADNGGTTVMVTGRVYRECTVNMPDNGSFPLGNFIVNNWVDNQSWLSPGVTPSFTFTLTGCGEQVKVYIAATGTSVNSTNRVHWLANQTGTAPELAASLELVKYDGSTMPLPLNGVPYLYSTTASENTPVQVTLKGLLNRTDNSQRPVGTFRATLTVNFDFA